MSVDDVKIRRFSSGQRVHHMVMIVCFFGLVLTGFPQKYSSAGWAWGTALIFGGVERMRWLHHAFGTLMAMQLIWHFLELFWQWFIRRLPMTMMPNWRDVRDFFQQVGYNLYLTDRPARMGRYTFAEKLEYLALIWGAILMVVTGVFLLYPIHLAAWLPGEFIPAAKAAHGGEALLALLAVITWHFYHVHIAHWNPSMFSGNLSRKVYEEEHAIELETRMRGEQARPARLHWLRVGIFGVVACLSLLAVLAILNWLWGSPKLALSSAFMVLFR